MHPSNRSWDAAAPALVVGAGEIVGIGGLLGTGVLLAVLGETGLTSADQIAGWLAEPGGYVGAVLLEPAILVFDREPAC